MATKHHQTGEVIDPLQFVAGQTTKSLFKSTRLEVLRMVLPAGKKIAEHRAPSDVTIHCLKGFVALTISGEAHHLETGQMVCLSDREPHDLDALEDSVLLVTIVLSQKTID